MATLSSATPATRRVIWLLGFTAVADSNLIAIVSLESGICR
jgi:hypothetical protein